MTSADQAVADEGDIEAIAGQWSGLTAQYTRKRERGGSERCGFQEAKTRNG